MEKVVRALMWAFLGAICVCLTVVAVSRALDSLSQPVDVAVSSSK